MPEGWVSTDRGRHLRGRVNKNTAPEIALRKALHAAGGRFRLHRQLAKGCTPDIVLPGRRVAIFVDGCFWHGCPEHGRRRPWTGPNAERWAAKVDANAHRDRRSSELAAALGWQTIRVWECHALRTPDIIATSVLTTHFYCGQPPTQLNRLPEYPPK